MTNSELNRDIKRLYRSVENGKINPDFEKEFKRLYYADKEASVLTLKSLKIMMALNRIYRVIPFHVFYIDINL